MSDKEVKVELEVLENWQLLNEVAIFSSATHKLTYLEILLGEIRQQIIGSTQLKLKNKLQAINKTITNKKEQFQKLTIWLANPNHNASLLLSLISNPPSESDKKIILKWHKKTASSKASAIAQGKPDDFFSSIHSRLAKYKNIRTMLNFTLNNIVCDIKNLASSANISTHANKLPEFKFGDILKFNISCWEVYCSRLVHQMFHWNKMQSRLLQLLAGLKDAYRNNLHPIKLRDHIKSLHKYYRQSCETEQSLEFIKDHYNKSKYLCGVPSSLEKSNGEHKRIGNKIIPIEEWLEKAAEQNIDSPPLASISENLPMSR